VGEAMHALGIPTTRALAAVATGEVVRRDGPLPGALLTRVAANRLRVGTFQFFAARDQADLLRRVAEYAIARHDPQLLGRDDRYLGLLQAVVQRQAALVARWMGVGFIHGVMNTDNMTISGETIDYGPCAFMEAFNPQAVFRSIDHQGRYAFGNQPGIAQWNLARLAETLLPLIDADAERAVGLATEVVNGFAGHYRTQWLQVMRNKLGLDAESGHEAEDIDLAEAFLKLLHEQRVDHTLGWRRLADAAQGHGQALAALFAPDAQAALNEWLARWQARRNTTHNAAALAVDMQRANPAYIARNHQVEAALAAAVDHQDLAPFERLLAVLQSPFDERPEDAAFAEPAAAEATACYQTFCGT
jgi:serine/tyrosine/threonine adenylyltransferase